MPKLVNRDTQGFDCLVVKYQYAVRGYGPDAQLRLLGRTQFAGDQHVQPGVQGLGDLVPYRHATSWQSEDDGVVRLILPQVGGHLAPRVVPVSEWLYVHVHSISIASPKL